MNSKQIIINGKTYKSVEEMPPEVRAKYEEAMQQFSGDPMQAVANLFNDANKDGTPDMFEQAKPIHISTGMAFVVDGKTYNSLEELPADARAKYEQAMGAFDKNNNGIPDMVENMGFGFTSPSATSAPSTFSSSEPPRRSQPIPVSPSIEPTSSNGWMLAFLALLLLGMCAAGGIGVWYFYLR